MIVFSILILAFLWGFQVLFLNTYYEWSKSEEIRQTANKIATSYEKEGVSALEEIAYNESVCIEITEGMTTIYSTNMFNKGCMIGTDSYKQDFIKSNSEKQGYKLMNPKFKNQTLVYGMKLEENVYAYVSASLVPMDSTTTILAKQLIYVTFFVLLLGFVLSYFISKKLSKPIEKLNDSAKEMAQGNYKVTFETGTDIAEMNELANTLNYASSELSKTEELRRDLLANVSHDLKTPLTMIQAYAEMAHDLNKDKEEKRNQNLEVIMEEAKRLNLLVNDILDLSKLQAGTVNLHYEVFSITELIKMILKRYQYLEETEQYHFLLESEKDYYVKADKQKIEQVLYNLINNAINYAGEDKEIIIQLKEQETTILVSITDHGKGISKEDLNLIWDRYYKVDKKYQRNHYGSGLGLSIVKNILINHKVKYGVTSKKRKGTTFYFELEKVISTNENT